MKLVQVNSSVLQHCHTACLHPHKCCRSSGPKVPRTRNTLQSTKHPCAMAVPTLPDEKTALLLVKGQWHRA